MSAPSPDVAFEFTLFVSGASELSARAIANAREICETYLTGRYRLAIVDIHGDSAAAIRAAVLAVPALVRNQPPPERRVIGDLRHVERVFQALDLSVAVTPEERR